MAVYIHNLLYEGFSVVFLNAWIIDVLMLRVSNFFAKNLIASLSLQANPILHDGKTTELVDPCLSNEYDSDQLERMILAASLCIRRAARSRPRMSLVRSLLLFLSQVVVIFVQLFLSLNY